MPCRFVDPEARTWMRAERQLAGGLRDVFVPVPRVTSVLASCYYNGESEGAAARARTTAVSMSPSRTSQRPDHLFSRWPATIGAAVSSRASNMPLASNLTSASSKRSSFRVSGYQALNTLSFALKSRRSTCTAEKSRRVCWSRDSSSAQAMLATGTPAGSGAWGSASMPIATISVDTATAHAQ